MSSIEMRSTSQQSVEHLEQPLLKSKNRAAEPPGEALDQQPPQTLEKSGLFRLRRLIPHILILGIPICFIVLGGCLHMIHGEAKSGTGDAIMQAARVASTLWPIAFAAVVGPMVKALALYRAERGVQLGTLEVLTTSQTLVSTLRGCSSLRIFSIWTLLLTVIWALSPVGGQGVLRAIELHPNITFLEGEVQSFPINNVSYSLYDFSEGVSSTASMMGRFRAISAAALSSPDVGLIHANRSSAKFNDAIDRAGGTAQAIISTRSDLWNNVRVPFLHLLPGYDPHRPYDWVEIPDGDVPPYESLIGIPVRGIINRSSGNASFVVKSYYHYLSCGSWMDKKQWIQSSPPNLQNTRINADGTLDYGSIQGGGMPNIFVDIANDPRRASYQHEEPPYKQNLIFGPRSGYFTDVTTCGITTSYIDSMIECLRSSENSKLSCAARATKHTENLPLAGNLTSFDGNPPGKTQMLSWLPFTLTSYHPTEDSILEKYLKDPPAALDSSSLVPEFKDVPMKVFEARLSMIINTFLRASLDMPSLMGMKAMRLEEDKTWGNTTAIWTEFTADVYAIHTTRFTLYMVSTAVLAACGLVNIILQSIIRAPDFLGSVSALTRDSNFVDAPPGGSTMDGTERARLLKDKWVRIQDVKPEEEVGRVAFSDARSGGRLDWDRRYE